MPGHQWPETFIMTEPLPIFEVKSNIISEFKEKNRIVIHSPTGSGKSTQVPQFILDSNLCKGRILVLEPRRIAARMLASRVSNERGIELGTIVGFQTRFESAFNDDTRILYITEGVLPRKLLNDSNLSGIDTVIFDEFHERSLTTDLGLALVKKLQDISRPDLRIIIMSATLDSESLSRYLETSVTIKSAGRMYPVEERYIPSSPMMQPWDNALNGIRLLMREKADGDVLIFMPGAYEIKKTVDLIKNAALPETCNVMPMYGDLPWESQKRVMEPTEKRKIIVATNIAETSLTIPNVRHVIDSGLARVNRYDPGRGFNTLYVESISRASANQRAGRAGREGPGICIRLWGAGSHNDRALFSEPEILRVDLAEAVLTLKVLGISDPSLFNWFEPPPHQALSRAKQLLYLLGAFDLNGALTEDGKAMAFFPAHPRISRLLFEAIKHGVPHEGAFAAAVLSERPVLSGKPDLADKSDIKTGESDFEALAYLIGMAEKSGFSPQVCSRLGINAGAARQVLRTQAYYIGLLRKLHTKTQDTSSDRHALSKALLCSYPDKLARFRDNGTLQYVMQGNKSGELARESAARGAQLIIAADIREMRNRGAQARTILSLACGIDEEWLLSYFPNGWRSETRIEWEEARMMVVNRVRTWCLDVLIEELTKDDVDPVSGSVFLASIIIDKKLRLEGFEEETDKLIDRIKWLALKFPDKGLPDFGDNERNMIIREMCIGETRYSAIKNKPALQAVYNLLGTKKGFVETMAPSYITLPNNRRMPIVYKAAREPVGRTRIQDLYGMNESPTVAGGSVSVLIEILAPNNRPVQVTNDLKGFWECHYPELKKTLSRRYPKHEWR